MEIILKASISNIVEYLWQDELRHYMECFDDANTYKNGHIFLDLEKVKFWLEGREPKND